MLLLSASAPCYALPVCYPLYNEDPAMSTLGEVLAYGCKVGRGVLPVAHPFSGVCGAARFPKFYPEKEHCNRPIKVLAIFQQHNGVEMIGHVILHSSISTLPPSLHLFRAFKH